MPTSATPQYIFYGMNALSVSLPVKYIQLVKKKISKALQAN